MALKIMPHGRLQEWVADEKGYFTAEGLEYGFVDRAATTASAAQRDDDGEIKTGAYESYEAGRRRRRRELRVPLGREHRRGERTGQLVTTAYSVAPCAIVVPPESRSAAPRTSPGSRSASATTPAATSRPCRPSRRASPDEVKLDLPGPAERAARRVLDRQVPAATTWGVQLYIAEAIGFRKVLDTTFMIAFLVNSFDAAGRRREVLQRPAARPDGDRPAPRALQALPPEVRAGEVPGQGRRAGLRHRRADRLSALHRGSLCRDPAVDAGPEAVPGAVPSASATTRPPWSDAGVLRSPRRRAGPARSPRCGRRGRRM